MLLTDTVSEDMSEWHSGLVFALLSEIAYDTNQDRRRARFSAMGAEEIATIECGIAKLTGLEAYILAASSSTIIVFRGSQEAIDWFHNARASKRRALGVLVHRGFADSAGAFMNSLANFDERSLFTRPIWVTGHSLGGAVAMISAYALQRRGQSIERVITYGSPRVGGPLRWRRPYKRIGLQNKTTRWVNGQDLVTRIPFFVNPLPWNVAWSHIGPQHYIEEDMVRFYDNRVLKPHFRFGPGFDDHSLLGFGPDAMTGYIRNIHRLMPAEQREELSENTTTSLNDSLEHLSRIYERDVSSSISAFSQAYDRVPNLSAIGLQFR